MKTNKFKSVATTKRSPKWDQTISRECALPNRGPDIRSEFARDNNRILHSTAYRRLKHKTQVFFATANDHVCTRIEHVNHVSSVSHTIAMYLGLNVELTSAIAIGHDLGHAPFGHAGEDYIKKITKDELGENFWHERNSLRFVDDIETLEDHHGKHINLGLTYGVRDGIVCHCGEINENALKPRDEAIDLKSIIKANEFSPYTWEGCVVKISDKIAYLGRDIEDALTMRILTMSEKKELFKITQQFGGKKIREINNTILIHSLIIDLCRNSSPEEGIKISTQNIQLMNMVKQFNYKNIYVHKRLDIFKKYAELIIQSLYQILVENFSPDIERLIYSIKKSMEFYPVLCKTFLEWLLKYGIPSERKKEGNIYQNKLIYDLTKEAGYKMAIIDFISGMTDNFAIKSFNETITFI
ncbi:MAG: dNTP triphosphohydrolase [Desulfobulbaceae bacterium]|nr:dNTP triphosphohydrolase [Desulfobulbaceae bacterium]